MVTQRSTEKTRGPQRETKMKIVYLITGSGGSFYCGNCYRDMLYVRAIRKVQGITASAIPLYLPPDKSVAGYGFDKHVFFGAISMYVREKIPGFRRMPDFLDKLFDAGPMLRIAARQAGTTRTEGLEDLTLNMIRGDSAFREHEVDRLVNYLNSEGKPDIIHLSNALVIGLARQLKKRMDVRIICSLLNEDDWIDEMKEPYRTRAWEMIASEAGNVDTFVTPSEYYRDLFICKTGLKDQNISIVPIGVETSAINERKETPAAPSIGYLCRMNRMNGFDKIVDSFISLKSRSIRDLTLHVCGGYTGDDKPFIGIQVKKIKKSGYLDSFIVHPDFDPYAKQKFFESIHMLSVPVRKYDGYGLYILESNAARVPVVQPATGAFPEIIKRTGGGIVYSPDSNEELSENLQKLFIDSNLRNKLALNGHNTVLESYSLDSMSRNLTEVYFNQA